MGSSSSSIRMEIPIKVLREFKEYEDKIYSELCSETPTLKEKLAFYLIPKQYILDFNDYFYYWKNFTDLDTLNIYYNCPEKNDENIIITQDLINGIKSNNKQIFDFGIKLKKINNNILIKYKIENDNHIFKIDSEEGLFVPLTKEIWDRFKKHYNCDIELNREGFINERAIFIMTEKTRLDVYFIHNRTYDLIYHFCLIMNYINEFQNLIEYFKHNKITTFLDQLNINHISDGNGKLDSEKFIKKDINIPNNIPLIGNYRISIIFLDSYNFHKFNTQDFTYVKKKDLLKSIRIPNGNDINNVNDNINNPNNNKKKIPKKNWNIPEINNNNNNNMNIYNNNNINNNNNFINNKINLNNSAPSNTNNKNYNGFNNMNKNINTNMNIINNNNFINRNCNQINNTHERKNYPSSKELNCPFNQKPKQYQKESLSSKNLDCGQMITKKNSQPFPEYSQNNNNNTFSNNKKESQNNYKKYENISQGAMSRLGESSEYHSSINTSQNSNFLSDNSTIKLSKIDLKSSYYIIDCIIKCLIKNKKISTSIVNLEEKEIKNNNKILNLLYSLAKRNSNEKTIDKLKKQLYELISKNIKQFENNSKRILLLMMEYLDMDLTPKCQEKNKIQVNLDKQIAYNDFKELYFKPHQISQFYLGILKKVYFCKNCNKKNYKFKNLKTLFIEVDKDKVDNQYNLKFKISLAFGEKINSNSKYKCQNCGKNKFSITKKICIKCPDLLIICFENKLNQHQFNINLVSNLDLSKDVETSIENPVFRYQLNSFIDYDQETGEYRAYVKVNDVWNKYSKYSKTQVNVNEISKISNPQILFYEKQESG